MTVPAFARLKGKAKLRVVRWEYLTVELKTSRTWSSVKHKAVREELNEAGAAGWELVSVFDTNDRSGRTANLVGVFKRPID